MEEQLNVDIQEPIFEEDPNPTGVEQAQFNEEGQLQGQVSTEVEVDSQALDTAFQDALLNVDDEELLYSPPNNVSTSLNEDQPITGEDVASTALDIAVGIYGGVSEALVYSPAKLIKDEIAIATYQATMGMSREEAQSELLARLEEIKSTDDQTLLNTDRGAHFHKQIEMGLPEEYRTNTAVGGLANGISQFATSFIGVGKFLKATKIAGGVTKIAQKLPQLGAAAEFGLATTQAALADFIGFEGKEGNLANVVQDVTEMFPDSEFANWLNSHVEGLAVDEDDTDLEARVKNLVAAAEGEALFPLGLAAAKFVRNISKLKNTPWDKVKGGYDKLKELLDNTKKEAEAIQQGVEQVKKETTDNALDVLFNDGFEPEIILPDDSMQTVGQKLARGREALKNAFTPTDDKAKALRDAIEEKAKEASKRFDSKKFQEGIEREIQSGEFTSVAEHLRNSLGDDVPLDIKSFKKTWGNVVESTVKSIQRYVPNAEQKSRAMKALALGLSEDNLLDKATGGYFEKLLQGNVKAATVIEEAAANRLQTEFWLREVARPEMLALRQLRHKARFLPGNEAKQLDKKIMELSKNMFAAEESNKQLMSEAGRLLQTGQIKGFSRPEVDQFVDYVNRLKMDAPFSGPGDKEVDEVLDAVADELNTGNPTKDAKHFSMFQRALNTASSVGEFTNSATRELFFNNVLGRFSTMKAIGFGNAALGTYQRAALTVGSMGNAKLQQQSMNEIVGTLRYLGEGIAAGFDVLLTGRKNPLDYTPTNPSVISAEGIRQTFGKSFGDVHSSMAIADSAIDALGAVVNIPTKNLIGGIDTAFSVANQRGMLYGQLTRKASDLGITGAGVHDYAVRMIDDVAEDLIMARTVDFDPNKYTPKSGVSLEELKMANYQIVTDTDTTKLSRPLRGSGAPIPEAMKGLPQNSDRWAFRALSAVDSGLQTVQKVPVIGLLGMPIAPFTKTFANALQFAADASIVGALSPYNRRIIAGEFGERAKAQLMGQWALSAGFSVAGLGLSLAGYTDQMGGSKSAVLTNSRIDGESTFTVRVPGTELAYDTSKFSPVAEQMMIPAKIAQIGISAGNRDADWYNGMVQGITLGMETGGSARFLYGGKQILTNALDPTYSTPDSLMKSLVIDPAASTLLPGYIDDIRNMVDPVYRDPGYDPNKGIWGNIQAKLGSRMPWLSEGYSPNYDLFGNPRPNDDYVGGTVPLALKAAKVALPGRFRYVNRSPLATEIKRFGQLGKTLTPLQRNLSVNLLEAQRRMVETDATSAAAVKGSGVTIPLDQFRNSEGKSLWDYYNENFATLKPYNGMTLTEKLDEIIESDVYKNQMKDNETTKLTGKRQTIVGSRFATIQEYWQDHKKLAKEQLEDALVRGKLEGFTNAAGQDINEVYEMFIKKQEDLSQIAPPSNPALPPAVGELLQSNGSDSIIEAVGALG